MKRVQSHQDKRKKATGVHYRVKGEGTQTVFMLCGMGRSSAYWLGFDRKLAKHYRVVTMDPRGIGHSAAAPVSWSLSVNQLADDVLEVMDKIGCKRAHLFGNSLGGMVAMAIGLKAPERTISVALANSSIGHGNPLTRLSPKGIQSLIIGLMFKSQIPAQMARALLSPSLKNARRMAVIQKWRHIQQVEGLAYSVVVKQFLAAATFNPKRRAFKNFPRTLVITGQDDTFVPHANSNYLAKLIPNSKLIVIPKAGHEPFIEAPDTLLAKYISFLKH